MRKTVIFILVYFIYICIGATQKPSTYINKKADLSKITSFAIDQEVSAWIKVSDPFINKDGLNINEWMIFCTYNEISLKNIPLSIGKNDPSDANQYFFNIYVSDKFNASMQFSSDYKPKSIKGDNMIIDIVGKNFELVWRSWISLSSIKEEHQRNKYQKAVSILLAGFKYDLPLSK